MMNENNIKILVIEDERFIRENIEELLQARGYHVHAASNGVEGVEKAIKHAPDLVVCDVMMPKMDGFKVLEQIRNTESIQNTPFIFLTAKIDKSDIRQGMGLGADDYLTKPFSGKELAKAIESRLERYEKINAQYSKIKHELDTDVFTTYYHEFNTPLHGIIGGLNLLINAGQSFTKQQVNDLHVSILKSAVRLNHSLANLMLYEEIRRAEIEPEHVHLFKNGKTTGDWPKRITSELLTLANEVYTREEDLQIHFELTSLFIAQEYLIRIVSEISDNALKFSKKGQPVIIKGEKRKNKYVITIADEGSGFTFVNNKDIGAFKQFNRRKLEQQGLGIGLHLANRLIEFNDGDLSIQSKNGAGTTVTIQLNILPEL
jgi:CheY-like chemotaxis protein/anti-sigma regulatory factor (Ser/Thr protein kinase)